MRQPAHVRCSRRPVPQLIVTGLPCLQQMQPKQLWPVHRAVFQHILSCVAHSEALVWPGTLPGCDPNTSPSLAVLAINAAQPKGPSHRCGTGQKRLIARSPFHSCFCSIDLLFMSFQLLCAQSGSDKSKGWRSTFCWNSMELACPAPQAFMRRRNLGYRTMPYSRWTLVASRLAPSWAHASRGQAERGATR